MRTERSKETWYERFLRWAGGEEPDGPEGPEDPERQEAPFSSISWVLETQDLLAPIFENSILLLQKKDLLAGPLEELFALLAEQTALVRAEAL